MEFKLESGRKIKLKDVSIDERDEMMDSIEWEMDKDGNPSKIKMMHSTMTKWIRLGLDGDTSDKFLKSITFKEKVEIFSFMQKEFMSEGEDKPSNSK
jgi:hypothetical protein|tara:strand:+ start:1671 stop:1961 length:291 start_codon:yes stop_codon:yes gene_type:complete